MAEAGMDIKNRTRRAFPHDGVATSTNAARVWGAFPALATVNAVTLLLISLADAGARSEAAWAVALFWVGLFVLGVPIAARLACSAPSSRERVALLSTLGLSLYLVKLLYNPMVFTFADELMHWRTADDIVRTGRLFNQNPLLPVSPFYPGLEIVTDALVSLSCRTIFASGVVVVGAARLVLVISLFLLYEEISRSPRIAGIAALLYMANPNFVFFGGQFAYESLALSFGALALVVMTRRGCVSVTQRVGYSTVLLLLIAATVVTHHVTGFLLAAFLVLWTVIGIFRKRVRDERRGPGVPALIAAVASLAWLVYVATLTVGYLTPLLRSSLVEFGRWIIGDASGRELFRAASGQVQPLWTQVIGVSSVVLILLALFPGLVVACRRYRASPLALALAAGSLAYPASLILRLTPLGVEVAGRLPEFLYVGVAFVVAIGFGETPLLRSANLKRAMTFGCYAAILIVGGVIVGWGPWERLPGPYLVEVDGRSVDAIGLATARWARTHLDSSTPIAADWMNRYLLGAYGGQHVVSLPVDRVSAGPLFFADAVGPDELVLIRRVGIRRVLVDYRLATDLPVVGIYVDDEEPNAFHHVTPIDWSALAKFDALDHVNRLYDSGDIVIYDMGRLLDGK